MAKARCVCGCGAAGRHKHHVVFQQHIRVEAPPGSRGRLLRDSRNLVPMALACHSAFHGHMLHLPARRLPDSVFEFAVELLGPGAAYEYLSRRYSGSDERLGGMLRPAA